MRIKNSRKNKGMTMVETLAAFTILIILSLSFLAIIQFSTKMTMDADDNRSLSVELDERLAKNNAEAGFTQKLHAGNLVLVNRTDSKQYTLKNCDVYILDHPVTDPKVRVIRFEYKE